MTTNDEGSDNESPDKVTRPRVSSKAMKCLRAMVVVVVDAAGWHTDTKCCALTRGEKSLAPVKDKFPRHKKTSNRLWQCEMVL